MTWNFLNLNSFYNQTLIYKQIRRNINLTKYKLKIKRNYLFDMMIYKVIDFSFLEKVNVTSFGI